jgi:cell division septum initiation protein DivIVA
MLDYTQIQIIQAVGTLVLSLVALLIMVWLAYKSPQARLAKFEMKERNRMQMQDHYTRLDQHIFRPLSSLIASSPDIRIVNGDLFYSLKLTYNLEHIRSSHFYPDALKHLKKDYPTFEEDVRELEKEIEKLNSGVDKLRQEAEEITSSRISALATVTKTLPIPQGSVFLPNVIAVLEGYWLTIVYRHVDLKMPLEEVLSNLKPFEMQYSREPRPNGIWFGGYLIIKGLTQDKEAKIISTIEQFRSDKDILSKLIELKKKHKKLISKSRQIANKVEEISFKIDAKKYKTVASCCP